MSFVGIGMGAIQAGLFLPRAQEAGLARTVLVRRPAQASALAEAGAVTINVARADGIHRETVDHLGAHPLDAPQAVEALTAATHVAIAVSSVADYAGLAPLLRKAMARKARGHGPTAVVYTSENALDAAAQLEAALAPSEAERAVLRPVDTVIGKMSRTVRDPDEIAEAGLARGAPGLPEAWLVEAYDDIYVSDPGAPLLPRLMGYADLAPFERAKLNGHNAAHAAFAYVGRLLGLPFISDVSAVPEAHDLIRGAFVEETGAALIRAHGGHAPLFTEHGWRAHADDLFARMANPWLRDDCDRVGRDTARKLGWDDRLVGTIRMVGAQGLEPPRWQLATHAAIEASGVGLDTLARDWRATGAKRREIDAMLQVLARRRPDYEAWRRRLGVPDAAE